MKAKPTRKIEIELPIEDDERKPLPLSERRGLSIAETAELYGISKTHLYDAIRAGKGPEVVLLGSRRVILREDADAWFRARRGAWTPNLKKKRNEKQNEQREEA